MRGSATPKNEAPARPRGGQTFPCIVGTARRDRRLTYSPSFPNDKKFFICSLTFLTTNSRLQRCITARKSNSKNKIAYIINTSSNATISHIFITSYP